MSETEAETAAEAETETETEAETETEEQEEVVVPRPKAGRALLHLRGVDLIRIGMFATLLVVVLVMRQPCADGMARFIGSFEDVADGGAAVIDAGPAGSSQPRIGEFRRLTDDEIRAIFNGDAGSLLDDDIDAGAGAGR